ncbi:sce7725 family protein [Rahnella perminowiae]|uniref:sce7725 family protein n=1 Tax=Rahnella perminowiae TaxID=2816244 RepID=UPI00215C46BB|nr:sce7725 family protein [Rahnella perminowiae]MCR9002730.1 sce7725 family protein [Rahnella perminowiae]
MYFPLVRGKQFELVALRELACIVNDRKFKPIIEPVRDNYTPLVKTIQLLNKNNIVPLVIINPSLGDFKDHERNIIDEILKISDSVKYIPCLKVKEFREEYERILSSLKGKKAVYIFDKLDSMKMSLLKNVDFVLVPSDSPTRALASLDNVILIDDAFKKEKKNADYSSESYFSDLHVSYLNNSKNIIGFGDYTIVGSDYSESGGPAYVVTIHLSYIDHDNFDSMSVKHFSSKDNNSLVDPGGKFREALALFYSFNLKYPKVFDLTEGKKNF